ncbi:MAG: threonine--tRNA ligase [bacterium]
MDLETLRHSTAHVMAAAICRLYENVQLDIGPAIESGFYYDFDLSNRLTPEDFPKIEAEMARIVAENAPFERLEMDRAQAEEALKAKGQRYKLERLSDIPAGETITFFRCGDFMDLCRGPHVAYTGEIKAFKLLSVAGSYFRGIETNPMLQRVYGMVALSQADLEAQILQQEEALKRDHRKLGKELDLFSIQEDVGPGLVHWHPKGARIRSIIEDYWRQEHFKGGYELLYTPHIGRAGLWETSGHLGFYSENMYAPMKVDDVSYYAKPMNCPFHIQIYKSHKRSYRDLPLRWAEMGTVYRYEKTGVLHGLLRVRGFTQDDAHIFCTPDQIVDEIKRTVKFALKIWRSFGFTEITAYLATKPAKAVGDPARWEQATESLKQALEAENIPFVLDDGGGAFYGPKIDLKVKDAIGREWQMSTIQFDFNLPERFELAYHGDDGKEHQPYMVHRALLGSLERFFGVLIEHYAGAFPLWLAPEQIRVLPISDKVLSAAEKLAETLGEELFRVSVDRSSDKLGAKIRNAQVEKIPYMLILGAREAEAGLVSVRSRTGGDLGTMKIEELVGMLREEVVSKAVGGKRGAVESPATRR